MNLVKGDIVAERYRLEHLVGEGGMGVVWAATHTVTRRRVALKFLKRVDAAKMRSRFMREARAASVVRHPNVVQIFDVLETDDGTPVMVMEFLVGESLAQRLDRVEKMPLDEVSHVILGTTSAVGTAHSLGIIHRDLKPDNIFLCVEGSITVVKVLDFGIAKLTAASGDAAETAGLTHTGALVGTPYYMSPEQAFGDPLDHRSDIWSLGLIAYQCLSGVLPTRRDNLGQIFKILMHGEIPPLEEHAPDLPEPILTLVGRMLSKSPDARPSDLREIYEVFANNTDPSLSPSFGPPAAPREGLATEEPSSMPVRTMALTDDSLPMQSSSRMWWLGLAIAAGAVGAVALSQTWSADRQVAAPIMPEGPAIHPAAPSEDPSVSPHVGPGATSSDPVAPAASSAAMSSNSALPPSKQPPIVPPPAEVTPSATAAPSRTGGVVEDPPF